jgi:hypothetical protein
MSIRPDFAPDQLRALKRLKLCDQQIDELRGALIEVRRVLSKPAARNDVRSTLKDVKKQSSQLAKMLRAIGDPQNAARAESLAIIEQGYWQGDFLSDVGCTSMHHMVPRLEALAKAAAAGLAELSDEPTRHRSADPRPVKRIQAALRNGWRKAHGSSVRSTSGPETIEQAMARLNANPPPAPYPKKLDPSRSATSTFFKVVGICYAAVGGNPDPDGPIRNYLNSEKAKMEELSVAFKKGVAKAAKNS